MDTARHGICPSSATTPLAEFPRFGGLRKIRWGPKILTAGRTLGGNLLLLGKAALIFPVPFYPDVKSMRPSLFVDAGQVYNTHKNPKRYGHLRYSVGASLTWNSPFGTPLVFSLAKPLNAKPGEEKKYFQFTMGTH